ncbi:hypothetical protein B7486_11375 [cyanobacterium TDX16]|nr:hypothetical protein B7486_11375 [cyanobacterium TDX16]
MAYLLDTNVFIGAKNFHYGMDFCPGFWDWLVAAAQAGTVASIVQVADEIQDDELNKWLPSLGEKFFRQPDSAVLTAMAQVSEWVNTQKYNAAAKSQFLNVADYHLIAHALAGDHVVVTHEQIEHTAARVKIPNVCIALSVKYVQTHVMLRRERARFVLADGL